MIDVSQKPDSIRIEIRTGDHVQVVEIDELIGGVRVDMNGNDGSRSTGHLDDHFMVNLVALGRVADDERLSA